MQQPSVSVSGERVLVEAGIERFSWHTPQDDASRRWLDLAKLPTTLEPCATYAEMLTRSADHPVVPMALLGLDMSAWKRMQADGIDPGDYLREMHSFHRLTPSYICGPFRVLVEKVFARLQPRDRNLAALVLPNRPVHYYADLDGSFPWCLGHENECRAEFLRHFVAFFEQTYRRAPDVSGMHWEKASREGKCSLHVHVTTEAFASHLDLKEFDRCFQLYLQSHCDAGASFVCRAAAECLVDSSVYNVHSLIRLHGNCKPRGVVLTQFVVDAEAAPGLSDAELLWRGLPNFALPPQPYAYLHCAPDAAAAAGASQHAKRRRVAADGVIAAPPPEQERRLLDLLRTYVGPGVQHVRVTSWAELEGACAAGSAWCVRLKHLTQPQREHIHGSNRTMFRLKQGRHGHGAPHTLVIRCLHPHCKDHPLEVDATKLMIEQPEVAARPLHAHGPWMLKPASSMLQDVDASIAAELQPVMRVVEVDIAKLDCRTSPEWAAFTQQHMQQRGVAFLQSQQGTGKTELILNELKVAALRDPQVWCQERTLWFSARRFYANNLGERIRDFGREAKVDGLQFADYTEYDNNATMNPQMLAHPRVILSLESLDRLLEPETGAMPHFTRIVMDELEELLRVLHGSTMNGRRARVFPLLLQLLQHAHHVWVADADLHPSTGVRFIREHLSDRPMAYLLNRRQTIQRDYCFFPSSARKDVGAALLAQRVLDSLRSGLKCFIVSNGKAPILALARWLGEHMGCALQDSEGASGAASAAASDEAEYCLRVVTGDSDDVDKKRLMTDPRAWMEKPALVVSPVVGPGINFDREYFDVAFLLVGRHTTTPCQTFQQLNRVRRLRLNLVYVHVMGEDDDGDGGWNLERVRAETLHNLRAMQKRHDDLLRVEYAPAAAAQLVPGLPDTGYNAVFVRNQLQVYDGRSRMRELLQQGMRHAGGRIWEYDAGEGAVSLSGVQKQLQEADAACKNEWAQRVARAPDLDAEQLVAARRRSQQQQATQEDRWALHKAAVRDLYGLPLERQLSPAWMEHFGDPFRMESYQRLLVAAQGGTAHLAEHVAVSDAAQKLHLTHEYTLMQQAERMLFVQLRFTSWASFLTAEQRVRLDDVVVDGGGSAMQVVRDARSFLKRHFGVGLRMKQKQVDKRKCTTYEVEPCEWEWEEEEDSGGGCSVWEAVVQQAQAQAQAKPRVAWLLDADGAVAALAASPPCLQ